MDELPKEMIQKNGAVKDIFRNYLVFLSNVGGCIRHSLLNISIAKKYIQMFVLISQILLKNKAVKYTFLI